MSDVGGIGGSNGTNGLGSSSLGSLTAANALAALRRQPGTTVEIVDTVQNILQNLDALQAVSARITAVSTNDTTKNMAVTASQYQKDAAVLALWGAGTGQTLSVTGVKAASASSLASYVTSVSVSDTNVNLQSNLNALETLAASGKLQQIVQTGSGSLSITSAQLVADQTALSKFKNQSYSLNITNASVSDVLGLDAQPALSTNAKVKSISIVDTTDAIATHLDALQRVGLRIKTIAQTDAETPLELTGDQYKQDKVVLGKIITSDFLAVIDASASQAKALAADHKVVTVGIRDSANNIGRNWALLQKLGDSLTSVEVADQANDISLTLDQFASSSALISKLVDTEAQSYKLAVTNVGAGSALEIANSHNVDHVDVSDNSANLVSSMDDLQTINGQGKLRSITLTTPRTPLTMDASRLQGDQLAATQGVLTKIKGGNFSVAVTGAALSGLDDLISNKRVVSIAVSDSSNAIETGLDKLYRMGNRLTAIEQTDPGTAFDLTQAQLDSRFSVLSKITDGYTVNLTNVTAAKAAADAKNGHVARLDVSDTSSNIAAYWTALRSLGSTLNSISQSDSSPISLTATNYELGVHDDLVSRFGEDTTFSVYGATVAQAQSLSADQAVTQIDVSDLGSNIVDNLTALETLAQGDKLHSIINQTPTSNLALNASQLEDAQAVLDLIKGGSYALALDDVAVADAKALLAANSKIAKMAVTGDAATIVANLSDLNDMGAKLASITQSDAPASTLAMSGAVFEQNASALAKIQGGYLATLSEVSAAKAAAFAANASVSSLAVSDTGDNLSSAWNTLVDMGDKLTEVEQTDSSTLAVGAGAWLNGDDLRGKFTAGPTVSILGADVSQVAGLASDDAVEAISVTGSSGALSTALASLAAQTKVTELVLEDSTVAMTMSGTSYSDYAGLLGVIKGGDYTVELSDVAAQDVATLSDDSHVAAMDVSDTSSEISSNFDALAAATKLNTIAMTDEGGTVTLTAAQILENLATLDKIAGSYGLAATDVAMADLSSVLDVPQVSSIGISDTSENVSSNFSDILALGGMLDAIALSDSSPVLSLSEQDFTAGAAAFSKIADTYQVDVNTTAAGDAETVASDSTVRSVLVADTASNIANHWDTLVSLYADDKLTGLSLTDANTLTLTAAQQTAGAAMIADLLPDETVQTA